jgi:thiol-disulfide isomerase/thioredoxin
MLKLLPLIFIIACGACGPSTVEFGTDTDKSVSIEPVEPYPWATWETCAHDIGDNPCNFELMDQNGLQADLYQHYGKVILLDFSVMWCGPCNSIAPIGDIWTEAYGEDNFVWITVLIEDTTGGPVDLSDLQAWTTTYSISGPVLASSRDMIDTTEPLEDGYPITAWPTIVMVDRTMRINNGMNGFNESTIQTWIESLL